ncbi:hypothetical protein CDES_08320 [Corynebacterium deserti GIMN1.010]|uniref:DUF3817 domain-containing protein n=1 Tax=Corynebacterium deserti GIMN1.010 TaxID=931089 RepID=A0A0M3Q9P6_9CORY|nr:DUF3817 domain-containing protein [Corynebacterium deserti]ALC06069.1 hypothetical protein CDES_08320 [Corynebacterium deserti GIMN1.010]
MTPKSLHRFAAILEMFTWTFLILGMILKYGGITDAVTPIAGGIHGFGFLCFAAITITVWINNRWSFAQGFVGLIVSVIPWAALPFTLWADKKGLLNGGWRFSDPAEKPETFFDKILAQLVRHPVRSIVILLIIIAIVFSILLAMGPPYDPNAIEEAVS